MQFNSIQSSIKTDDLRDFNVFMVKHFLDGEAFQIPSYPNVMDLMATLPIFAIRWLSQPFVEPPWMDIKSTELWNQLIGFGYRHENLAPSWRHLIKIIVSCCCRTDKRVRWASSQDSLFLEMLAWQNAGLADGFCWHGDREQHSNTTFYYLQLQHSTTFSLDRYLAVEYTQFVVDPRNHRACIYVQKSIYCNSLVTM